MINIGYESGLDDGVLVRCDTWHHVTWAECQSDGRTWTARHSGIRGLKKAHISSITHFSNDYSQSSYCLVDRYPCTTTTALQRQRLSFIISCVKFDHVLCFLCSCACALCRTIVIWLKLCAWSLQCIISWNVSMCDHRMYLQWLRCGWPSLGRCAPDFDSSLTT